MYILRICVFCIQKCTIIKIKSKTVSSEISVKLLYHFCSYASISIFEKKFSLVELQLIDEIRWHNAGILATIPYWINVEEKYTLHHNLYCILT